MPSTNPTSVLTGTKYPQVQPSRTGRNESGTYTDIPYETTDFIQASQLALVAEINGIPYDWEQTFGKQKVTYHYPYNFRTDPATEPPVMLWELNNQRVQKSILDSSNVLANACTQGELYILGLFLADQSDYILTPSDGKTVTSQTGSICYPETTPTGNTSLKVLALGIGSPARTLANLIACGVTSYDVFQPQLKLTRTVNPQYPDQVPYANVGSIVSTNTMYNLYNIPFNVMFSLPNLMNPAVATGKPVLNYGWFVNAPQANQIARLKFQIIQTWDFGLWPVDLYGTPL